MRDFLGFLVAKGTFVGDTSVVTLTNVTAITNGSAGSLNEDALLVNGAGAKATAFNSRFRTSGAAAGSDGVGVGLEAGSEVILVGSAVTGGVNVAGGSADCFSTFDEEFLLELTQNGCNLPP